MMHNPFTLAKPQPIFKVCYSVLNCTHSLDISCLFKTTNGQRKRPLDLEAASQVLQDTLTDEELSMSLGEIIDDKAQKTRQSKTKASVRQQKWTAAQAMLENEPKPKTSSSSTYRGGLAGCKAFAVAELVLLNQCMDEIEFEGDDMWFKVAKKFNQVCHTGWPERGLNSLKKKFMEVIIYIIIESTGS